MDGEDLYPALIKEVEFIGFYADEEDPPDAPMFEVIVFWLNYVAYRNKYLGSKI